MTQHNKSRTTTKLPHPQIVAGVAAAFTLVIAGSGFAFNEEGNVQEVESRASQIETPVDNPPTMAFEESSEFSDDQIVLSTVDFYRQACPSFAGLTTVTHTMSTSVEEAVGKPKEELAGFWTADLHEKAKQLDTASNKLLKTAKGHNLDMTPFHTTAGKTREITDAYRGYADAINPENVADLSGQARAVAANQGVELSNLVQGAVTSVPFPTTATANAVYALEECDGVFNTGSDAGHPVEAAVDFHKRLDKGANDIDATRKLLDEIEVTNDVEKTKTTLADVWLKRAEAAEAAANDLEQWRMPDAPTRAELDALQGYPESQKDAVDVWRGLAKVARDNESTIRSAEDSDSLNDALSAASDATWQQDVAEEKMLIRVNRVANTGQ